MCCVPYVDKKKVSYFAQRDEGAKISWFTYYRILMQRNFTKEIELNICMYGCVCVYMYTHTHTHTHI
jgi:hypothetical protein